MSAELGRSWCLRLLRRLRTSFSCHRRKIQYFRWPNPTWLRDSMYYQAGRSYSLWCKRGVLYLNAGFAMVAQNQWPDVVVPNFVTIWCPSTWLWSNLCVQLRRRLRQGWARMLIFFDVGYEVPLAPGQLVYYSKPNGTDMRATRFGAAAYLNFGASTIRLQDNNGGVQVRHKAGD